MVPTVVNGIPQLEPKSSHTTTSKTLTTTTYQRDTPIESLNVRTHPSTEANLVSNATKSKLTPIRFSSLMDILRRLTVTSLESFL